MSNRLNAAEILAREYIKQLINDHADIDEFDHFVGDQFATDEPAMLVVREALTDQAWSKVTSPSLEFRWNDAA